jgi:hypothetical protein
MTDETQNETNEQQTSLLGDTQPADATAPVEQTTEEAVDRPDWLPEKFKAPEDLAKSYNELEKKFAELPKAPKEYSWDFTENLDLKMTEDNDVKTNAEDMFRHLNLTQQQVEGVVTLYKDQLDNIDEQIKASQPARADLEQENANLKTKWGTEYDSKLEAVKKFAQSLPAHVLNYPLSDTADGLEILYNLMSEGKAPNPITNTQTAQTSEMEIREKIREMRMDDRMKLPQGDAIGDNFRAELYRLYEKLER